MEKINKEHQRGNQIYITSGNLVQFYYWKYWLEWNLKGFVQYTILHWSGLAGNISSFIAPENETDFSSFEKQLLREHDYTE